MWHSLPKGPPNNANVAELESSVFIGIGWGCEGHKATKTRRYLFQSANLRALGVRTTVIVSLLPQYV